MDFSRVLAALPSNESTTEPSFAFSIHKCGSTMMHAMINDTCHIAKIPAISLPDRFFEAGLSDQDWQAEAALVPTFSRNILYFGFRYLPALMCRPELKLREKRFVLLVRDPRDALVSQYFSFGRKKTTHNVPKQNSAAFLKKIHDQPELGIDEYVLNSAEVLRNKFAAYRDNLNFDLGMTRRYEDVFFDKQTFLAEIFEFFDIAVPADVIERVAKKHDIRPNVEDDTKHIRKGAPGDHAEKLQPETIAKLNELFRDVAQFYGYAL